MGIKHFFGWFRQNYPECIHTLDWKTPLTISIDTLGLDLNGMIHPCAQKIFQYGAHKPQERLLSRGRVTRKPSQSYEQLEKKMFQELVIAIEKLVDYTNPKRRLLLCVDGVAGSSKIQQQRARRFKSALENSSNIFDSCSITPGTEFMHRLCQYLEFFIHKKMTVDERWRGLEIMFSSEKVAGEGEHSITNYIKEFGTDEETYLIYGLDADLIMLTLSLFKPNVYILRDDINNSAKNFLINIGQFGRCLNSLLYTESAISDFVFLCFFMGNDFLPNIPSLEIITGGIDTILSIYADRCQAGIIKDDSIINLDAFEAFLERCRIIEIDSLKEKFSQRRRYFPDELMGKYFSEDLSVIDENGNPLVIADFDGYRKEYYKKHFPPMATVEEICHQYLLGMQFVITYYLKSIPSWTWCYPYHYAPFLCDLYSYIRTYTHRSFGNTQPLSPFQQLLSVLPPQSANLLPESLQKLITSPTSPLAPYYPTTFEVDVSGKRQEWEGIVKIPMMDIGLVLKCYNQTIVTQDDRDASDQAKVYYYNPTKRHRYQSRYGTIENCYVNFTKIK